LTWTHYSHASLRDAKIDTSRIKLANRDLAVLTPDESDWFRSLQFPPFPERGASQKLAGDALKFSSRASDIAYVARPYASLLEQVKRIFCHAV
jgi:hypothetical protein